MSRLFRGANLYMGKCKFYRDRKEGTKSLTRDFVKTFRREQRRVLSFLMTAMLKDGLTKVGWTIWV